MEHLLLTLLSPSSLDNGSCKKTCN